MTPNGIRSSRYRNRCNVRPTSTPGPICKVGVSLLTYDQLGKIRQGDDLDTTVLIERSVGPEQSELKMFVDQLKRMRPGLRPDDTVVTDGGVFLSNALLAGAEG